MRSSGSSGNGSIPNKLLDNAYLSFYRELKHDILYAILSESMVSIALDILRLIVTYSSERESVLTGIQTNDSDISFASVIALLYPYPSTTTTTTTTTATATSPRTQYTSQDSPRVVTDCRRQIEAFLRGLVDSSDNEYKHVYTTAVHSVLNIIYNGREEEVMRGLYPELHALYTYIVL